MIINTGTIVRAFIISLTLAVAACAAQQEDESARGLWVTEFLKKRTASKPTSTNSANSSPSSGPRKFSGYRRATPKTPATAVVASKEAAKDTAAPPTTTNEEKLGGELIGVTIWRLRAARDDDDRAARILLEEQGGGQTELTPERVEADASFAAGQRVRLSIESPRNGYLYVIDRELYADGSMSEPYLIFPTLRNNQGNNYVTAGKVIELPGKTAFRLTPSRADYQGESLTLLVTPEPLKEITVGAGVSKLDSQLIAQWEKEWSAPIERFEMIGGAGKTRTKAESEAGQEGSRLLTQDDELPQTLYHVAAKPGNPFLVSVTLKVGN